MINKMKNLLVVCFLVMASTCMAMAQQQQPNDGKKPGDGPRKRPNMEQLTKMQATRISQSLGLDDKTSQKFIETFCNCRKEMAATRPARPSKKRTEMTDAEVDKQIKANFQQGRKLLDIREKYYAAYSKFLTPKQIQRVYELERQDKERFEQRMHQRDGRNGGPRNGAPQNCGPRRGNPGKPAPEGNK